MVTEPIELHHRTYKRMGRESIFDIVPLCEDHHYEVERFIRTHDVARYDAHIHYVASLVRRRGDLHRHRRAGTWIDPAVDPFTPIEQVAA